MEVGIGNLEVTDNTVSLDLQCVKRNLRSTKWISCTQYMAALSDNLFTLNTPVNITNITAHHTTHAQALHLFPQHSDRPTLQYLVDCHHCLVFTYLRAYPPPPPPPPFTMSPTKAHGTLK